MRHSSLMLPLLGAPLAVAAHGGDAVHLHPVEVLLAATVAVGLLALAARALRGARLQRQEAPARRRIRR